MKKLFYAAFILLSLSALCTSCSKTVGDKLDDRLVGTKWQCRDIVYEAFFGGTCYQVYEFISTTEVELYTTRNGVVDDSNGTLTYTLNYPKIVIDNIDGDGNKKPTSYTFEDSRTMVRDGAENGAYTKYIKQ